MTTKALNLKNRKNRLISYGWIQSSHGIGRHGHYWTHEQVQERCTLRQAEDIQQSFEKNSVLEVGDNIQGMKARISSLERGFVRLQELISELQNEVRTNESVRNPTREY